MKRLKRQWEKICVGSLAKVGTELFQVLLDRKEGYYFSEGLFDIPGMWVLNIM